MRRRVRLLFGVAVLASGIGLLPRPAFAVSPMMTGGGVWGGTVTLLQYPCLNGCAFTGFSGWFAGSMQVVNAAGMPTYTAVWPSGAGMNLTMGPGGAYKEPDCGLVPGGIPMTGTATGTFTVSGGTMLLNGAVVGVASLTGSFAYSRTAMAFLIETTNVALQNNGTTVATSTGGIGGGVVGPPIEGAGDLPMPPSCSHIVVVTMAMAGTYTQPQ
jgi:hypothetical protein